MDCCVNSDATSKAKFSLYFQSPLRGNHHSGVYTCIWDIARIILHMCFKTNIILSKKSIWGKELGFGQFWEAAGHLFTLLGVHRVFCEHSSL